MSGDVVSQNLERLTRDTTQTWQIEIESSTTVRNADSQRRSRSA